MSTLQRLSELVPRLCEADRLALLRQVETMLLNRQRDEAELRRRVRRVDRVSLR